MGSLSLSLCRDGNGKFFTWKEIFDKKKQIIKSYFLEPTLR